MVNVNNQGAISLAKNPMYHKRSKHIQVSYHFIGDEIRSGKIESQYIPTKDNVANIFTKPITKLKLNRFETFISGPGKY